MTKKDLEKEAAVSRPYELYINWKKQLNDEINSVANLDLFGSSNISIEHLDAHSRCVIDLFDDLHKVGLTSSTGIQFLDTIVSRVSKGKAWVEWSTNGNSGDI